MSKVSKRFAERVKSYSTRGDTIIRSAEGRAIASSPASLAEGKQLSSQNLRRVSGLYIAR